MTGIQIIASELMTRILGFLARMQSGDLAKSFVKRPYKSKTEQRKKLA